MDFKATDLTKMCFSELEKLFTSHFDILALRHSYYNTFENFLDCVINGFCFNYDDGTMERIRSTYSEKERFAFSEMLLIWVKIMDINISSDNDFFDWFGYYYEKNAMSKKHGFAQFFTPESICKFMAMLVIGIDQSNYKFYEPTCGSGRLNLAAHSINHKMFHVANDLDYTCAKMTALNFMVHGIKGIVTCDDGLIAGSSFKGAFVINEFFAPSIRFISDVKEAYFYINLKTGNCTINDKDAPMQTESIIEEYKIVDEKKGQLSFF